MLMLADYCRHLDSLSALRELNLSDNAIVSFDELHNIARLKHVSSVSFTDQDFGPNPVCRLLNYQTVVRGLFQVAFLILS